MFPTYWSRERSESLFLQCNSLQSTWSSPLSLTAISMYTIAYLIIPIHILQIVPYIHNLWRFPFRIFARSFTIRWLEIWFASLCGGYLSGSFMCLLGTRRFGSFLHCQIWSSYCGKRQWGAESFFFGGEMNHHRGPMNLRYIWFLESPFCLGNTGHEVTLRLQQLVWNRWGFFYIFQYISRRQQGGEGGLSTCKAMEHVLMVRG